MITSYKKAIHLLQNSFYLAEDERLDSFVLTNGDDDYRIAGRVLRQLIQRNKFRILRMAMDGCYSLNRWHLMNTSK